MPSAPDTPHPILPLPVDGRLDVLLDVDGVLYPFPELFTPYVSRQLGRELDLDTTDWAFYARWGVDAEQFARLVIKGVDERELWWTGDPYADVAPAIERLLAAGHRLHLVTARGLAGDENAYAATHHWVAEHGLVVESVNVTDAKTVVVGELGLDPARCVAVDDGPHHVADWLDAGVYAVVLDRWGTYRGDLPAVDDLEAFADLLVPGPMADGNTSA